MSISAYSLAGAPLLPWSWIAVLAAVCLIVLAVGAWRRAGGLGWRAIALAILIAALVNPSLIEERRQPRRDIAVAILDQSPSQRIGQRSAVADAALATLKKRLAATPGIALRVVHAGAAPPAEGGGTRLFAALDREMAHVPRDRLAGVVMITDGEVADVPGGNQETLAKAVGAPLQVLLTGRHNEADRRLVVDHMPSFGLVGKTVTLKVRVVDEPQSGGAAGTAMLTWRKDAGSPHVLSVPIGHDVPVKIPIDHGGQNIVELSVGPGPHELTLANNRAVVDVNGVRDRLKVLLVTGEPYPGERVWRNILKSDPSVDLVHFTILRPPRKQNGTPIRELSLIAFPIRELFDVKLKQFDLIIFDQYKKRGVIPPIYLENVVRYVRDGGAFLLAAGPNFSTTRSIYRTPLGQLLPAAPTGAVEEVGFRPRLTALGRRDPVTSGLPGAGTASDPPNWGRWFRQVDAHVRRGTTVMRGAHGEPLLVLDRVGKGRVAELLSDEMWLWQRGYEGGGPETALLRRVAYWLMKEPALEENALRATIDGGRITVTRQSLKPDDRLVWVIAPDGRSRHLSLAPAGGGRSTGSLPITEMGLYRVTDGIRTALAAAGPLNPVEFAEVRTTGKKLAPVVKATGGGIFWLASGGVPRIRRVASGDAAAGSDWMGFRENGAYRVTGLKEIPLLPGLAALLLIVGGLLVAWRREGR